MIWAARISFLYLPTESHAKDISSHYFRKSSLLVTLREVNDQVTNFLMKNSIQP